MKLYYSDVLSAHKACAVAKYLAAPVQFVYVDLGKGEQRAPDYVALNPNAKVPTLVDGQRVIWEADAIMCHLAARAGSDLWPDDQRQIDVIRWFSWNHQHFTRAGGALFFEYIIKERFNLGPPDAAEVESALENFRRFAAILDAHLEKHDWLVGDALTVADFAVAVSLPHAERARIPLAEFPAVQRWHGRLNEIDAWRNPFPDPVKRA
ncbi:MAG: glutathione S-transferase family protein [Rhodanobacteraceae bacterium]